MLSSLTEYLNIMVRYTLLLYCLRELYIFYKLHLPIQNGSYVRVRERIQNILSILHCS